MAIHYHACWRPADHTAPIDRNARVGVWDTAEAQIKEKGALALTVAGLHAGMMLRMVNQASGKYEIRDQRDNHLWAQAWVEACSNPTC